MKPMQLSIHNDEGSTIFRKKQLGFQPFVSAGVARDSKA